MKRSNKIVTKAIILFVMTWIMILGAVSSKRLTVYASTYYSGYLVTNSDTAQTLQEKVVRFNGMDWYIIADNSTAVDAGTVTLFAKDKIANSMFNNSCGSCNYYCSSAIKSFLDNLTSRNGSFRGVSYVIADTDLEDVNVTGAKLWLLSTSEAEALNSNARKCSSNWWLRSPSPLSSSEDFKKAMFVDGPNGEMPVDYSFLPYVDMPLGVRPALNLKLTDVTFNQETKTFIPLLPALNPIENKTYNGNAQEPTITFESVNLTKDTDYTVSYEDSQGNVVTAPTNADTYTVTVTGIGNYSGTRTTSYTIEKEGPTITAPIPNTLIYTGSAQDLVTAGQTSFGTMVYSLDGTSYSEAIPVGTDVGTYYVWYMVKGDGNHLDSEPACVTVEVSPIITRRVVLERNITMVFYAKFGTELSETPVLTVTRNGEAISINGVLGDDGKYAFAYEKIYPQFIADELQCELTFKQDEASYTYTMKPTSVRDYCMELLNMSDEELSKYLPKNATLQELRSLLVDILVYGEEGQKVANYNVDDPATKELTPEQKMFATVYVKPTAAEGVVQELLTGEKSEDFFWTNVNLNLKNAATIRFFFRAPKGIEGLTVKVDGTAAEILKKSGDEYVVEVSKKTAGSYGDSHVAVFEKDGAQTGQTLQYSLNTYVSRMDGDATFGALIKSLYNYGKSALAYATP